MWRGDLKEPAGVCGQQARPHGLLSGRRLVICLAGDLFAGLGADNPGGHIPIVMSYLGCQAAPEGA